MLVFIYFLFAYFTLLFYRFLWFRALNQAMTVLKYVVIIILMGHNSNARNYQIINFLTSHYIQFGQAFTGSIVEHPVNLPMNPGQQSGTSSQVELSISLSSSPSFFFYYINAMINGPIHWTRLSYLFRLPVLNLQNLFQGSKCREGSCSKIHLPMWRIVIQLPQV